MSRIRVLLADDHILFREGVAAILNAQPDLELVGCAGDGLEAIERARELRPDLILMDIAMPHCDGLEATRRISAEMPEAVIVMLTMRDEDDELFAAIKAGAQGYLLKNARSRDLVELVRKATDGDAAITPAMAGRMLEEFRRQSQSESPLSDNPEVVLTRPERDVLTTVAEGASDNEIAQALGLSVPTVKSHMRHILAKLHRSQLQRAA